MATGPGPPRRTEPPARRSITRVATTVLTVIGYVFVYLFLFFFCQRMFGGYPQYYTDVITNIGVILIALTGGVAWILDERRIDGDG
jgi:hypothetical protein